MVAALLHNAAPFLADPTAALSGSPPLETTEVSHTRYEQVLPSGLSAIVEQRVFQLADQNAADLFAPDDVWYDSARNVFHLVHAEVLRRGPRGGLTVLGGADLGDLNPGATGNQPRRISLPPLRAGDAVDLLYVLLPNTRADWSLLGGHYLGNLFAFGDSYPTLRTRYVLAAAAPMTAAAVGVPAAVRGTGLSGDSTWAWQAGRLPAFFSSNDGPSITDRSPFVQVSGFASWAAMANWYSNVLARRAALPPALALRLLQTAAPDTDPVAMPAALHTQGTVPANQTQIRATVAQVWGYLSRHLNYRGDESGIHAYVPAPVAEVFASGQGDCKDGALLLVTWLRALGIDADLALVRTPAMGRLAPQASDGAAPATMAAFDHALVYVPATGQWIDTTAPRLLSSELPSSDENSLALIVRPNQNALVRVPVASAAANLTQRSVRLIPDGVGWWLASGELDVRGADAPGMRADYDNPLHRRAALQRWLRSEFPDAVVQSVSVTGVAPAADLVKVQFLARLRAQPHTVAWMHRHYAALLAAEVQRAQSLELPLRWEMDESWSLPLDPGVQSCPDTPPVHVANAFGQLDVSVSCAQGWMQVSSRVIQQAETVSPDAYPAFRAFWRTVDATLDAPAPAPRAMLVATSDNR